MLRRSQWNCSDSTHKKNNSAHFSYDSGPIYYDSAHTLYDSTRILNDCVHFCMTPPQSELLTQAKKGYLLRLSHKNSLIHILLRRSHVFFMTPPHYRMTPSQSLMTPSHFFWLVPYLANESYFIRSESLLKVAEPNYHLRLRPWSNCFRPKKKWLRHFFSAESFFGRTETFRVAAESV